MSEAVEIIKQRGRSSGRTFRAVLKSILAASEGERVQMLSSHGSPAEMHAFEMSTRIVSVLGGFAKIDTKALIIKIGEGEVRFRTPKQDQLRGLRVKFEYD